MGNVSPSQLMDHKHFDFKGLEEELLDAVQGIDLLKQG
jgi:hypothetical protein